jgi:hypothetical protein
MLSAHPTMCPRQKIPEHNKGEECDVHNFL